jgi:hypothetical protein
VVQLLVYNFCLACFIYATILLPAGIFLSAFVPMMYIFVIVEWVVCCGIMAGQFVILFYDIVRFALFYITTKPGVR